MCGRYTLRSTPKALREHFGLAEEPSLFPPRFNVAPTQPVPVVRLYPAAGRRLDVLRWGLVPHWSKDIGDGFINARAETAAEKPSFRDSLRRRRCLILADGFYEWAKAGGRKRPFHFSLWGGGPFAFAGLWDAWQGAGWGELETCAVLTTEANDLVRPAHDRMPVILAPRHYGLWLDPAVQDPRELAPLLRPYPSEEMRAVPVGPRVNNPHHDDPGCLDRAA
jgi:putative SOS response-associated peptidase YedK